MKPKENSVGLNMIINLKIDINFSQSILRKNMEKIINEKFVAEKIKKHY